MKVLKFGGTSVGTVESLRNVKGIVESLDEPAIVVVSALGGLTDKLIATARGAADGSVDHRTEMTAIRARHQQIIDTLVPGQLRDSVTDRVGAMLDELANLYLGVSLINELPAKTLDRIVSFGERMSSVIVAAIIDGAEHRDSLEFIKTERWHDRNIADRKTIETKVREQFGLPLKNHVVTGGFIARDRDTDTITNLGRGGSDFTAALIASALDADSLEIWTDVDGFMTADPRIIPDARVIPHMTFVESMELCLFGAKVIYPPTIYPVFNKNIPIRILNTHNPAAPGTLITDNSAELPTTVRGVSSVRGIAMLTLTGQVSSNFPEVNSRTFNAMARAGIDVLLVTHDDESRSYSISLKESDAPKAAEILRTEFAPELSSGDLKGISADTGMAVLAVVREGVRKLSGLGTRLLNTLTREGIEVLGLSDGASEATVAAVVNDQDIIRALQLVHDSVIKSSPAK